jgi:hypothetical protein
MEASIASLGAIFSQSGNLYPDLSCVSFHGNLYGPALAEVQSVFQLLPGDIIFTSKLAGCSVFFIAIFTWYRLFRHNYYRSQLIFVLSFGPILFWNRSEPFLLLISGIAATVQLKCVKYNARIFLLGLCAGLACCFKVHGALYVIAAAVLVRYESKGHGYFNFSSIPLILLGFTIPLAAAFSFQNVSFGGFIFYLNLAKRHGLSLPIFFNNFSFLFLASTPLIFIALINNLWKDHSYRAQLLSLIVIEMLGAIIASKPGAGSHHLIPFIAINGLFIDSLVARNKALKETPHEFYVINSILIFYAAICVTVTEIRFVSKFLRNWKTYTDAKNEVMEILNRADKDTICMGCSDIALYNFVLLRPILEKAGHSQVDYSAFMDLNYSGVTDSEFTRALKSGTFKIMLVPRGSSEPFSMVNLYTNKPLFSNETRTAFLYNYHLEKSYIHYSVYRYSGN